MKLLKLPVSVVTLSTFLIFGCMGNRESIPEGTPPPAASVKIGHADMDALFHSYSAAEEFYRQAEKIQRRFEELEEEDFEQMMQIQSEFQFLQMEFFANFREDVETAAKTISEDMGLHAVAVEILHISENAELIDVTEAFMETGFFNAGHSHSELCGPECR